MRVVRFVALLLTALTVGLAFAHALELGPKLEYEGSLYLRLHRTLYWGFGTIGAVVDVGAVIAAVVLAFVMRGRPGFRWALLGAAALVVAHVSWWIWVAPVNQAMRLLPLENPPAEWVRLRDQWEYTHLARFFAQLVGFGFQLMVDGD